MTDLGSLCLLELKRIKSITLVKGEGPADS